MKGYLVVSKIMKKKTLMKIDENFNYFENLRLKMKSDAAFLIIYHVRRFLKRVRAGRKKTEVKKKKPKYEKAWLSGANT